MQDIEAKTLVLIEGARVTRERAPKRPTGKHWRLARDSEGRIERMAERGAPQMLQLLEHQAQRDGFTRRRLPGLGEHYYRVPLGTDAEYLEQARRAQDRRLQAEERRQMEDESMQASDDLHDEFDNEFDDVR